MYNLEVINIVDYNYKVDLYYTNHSSNKSNYAQIKLTLNSSNFNFDLCKVDGSDFRLIDLRSNTSVLNMWTAKWNKDIKSAIIIFGVPDVKPYETIKLKACFGNKSAVSISNKSSVGLLLSYKFDKPTLDTSEWGGRTYSALTEYGYQLPSSEDYTIDSINSPLAGINNWILKMGLYADFDNLSITTTEAMTAGIDFTGPENPFTIGLLQTSYMRHNAVSPGGTVYSTWSLHEGGLEGFSYNEASISYDEKVDKVYVGLSGRKGYRDVLFGIGRKVEGDTRLDNIKINGRHTVYNRPDGGYPTYIQWIAIAVNDGINFSEMDASPLYTPYEIIPHQIQDFRKYGNNIINVQNIHVTSFGGNPYNLTDNNPDTMWISDSNAVSNNFIYLTFYTTIGTNIVNKGYLHYDSGHELYLNASKLSDSSDNIFKYFKATANDSWAAIRFDEKKNIKSFRILNGDNRNEMPKNYVFMGTNYNPYTDIDKAIVLSNGVFPDISGWICKEITNERSFEYYVLRVMDTYGSVPTLIKRWEMSDYSYDDKSYVSQLRLLPPQGAYTDMFPKEVSLLASNDDLTWNTLLPFVETYTPFMSHISEYGFWQYYNFYNTDGYKYYKLLFRGNWGNNSGSIAISNVSLHELSSEDNTYRLLRGNSNNIRQIWSIHDGKVLFFANNFISGLTDNKVTYSASIPLSYTDLNV